MKRTLTISFLLFAAFCLMNFTFTSGCYSFKDIGTIPDTIKTVKVEFISNQAPYVNPQLSPNLTDRIKQKINQTKLTLVNNDNADWILSGTIRDYSVTTTGISSANGQKQNSINRLTVGVHVIINKRKANLVEEFDVSRSFDFGATQSLQSAEAQLLDEMVKNLTDEIFNHIFSNW